MFAKRTLVRILNNTTMATAGVSSASPPRDVDFVQSLERGLSVLRVFDADHTSLTLSDVARLTGLTRATARRLLLTFERLGYMRADGRHFELTPSVLDLGYAFLSSVQLPSIAQPFMESLSEQVHESVSASVLDGPEIVYVARVPTKRIMTISLALGSRLPATCTSMGRVLLAGLCDEDLDRLLASAPLVARTERTIVDPARLREVVEEVRRQGWALVDQELEDGVRSIAAPVRDGAGRTVAAINVSTHAGRVGLRELRAEFVPALVDAATRITTALAKR
jgi:IclR family pca regulon transcriptional regulator